VFSDDRFLLFLVESGCSWAFMYITLRDVGVRKSDLYAILKCWVFVVFS
jgi:hypothetical protein